MDALLLCITFGCCEISRKNMTGKLALSVLGSTARGLYGARSRRHRMESWTSVNYGLFGCIPHRSTHLVFGYLRDWATKGYILIIMPQFSCCNTVSTI